MFKSHTPRMILLSALFLPSANLSADVLSSITTDDLIEPAGTYSSSAPWIHGMRVKTVIDSGPCETNNYDGCTLNDVLNDVDGSDDFKPEIKVHMTSDVFPDDGLVSNAEMRQRGSTSRNAPQKSFRIKLDSSDDLWRGERRIQLIKGFPDFSRVRNKLSYSLFVDIPNLPSMRTQFINLSVEDQGTTEDYGLYTQVEYFGKEYLTRRGWDKDSGVYKAENFYFKDDSAFALDDEGAPINEDAFEQLMEIKRGDDHREFVAMLQDLNNGSLDFNTQVFEKYFNKDNYLTWFAVNVLLDNYDTTFHNYYLYNPKGTEKFYFVPWDYDLALGALFDNNTIARTDLARWTQSHANWWGQKLHRQFLRQPGNLDLLRQAMREIKNKYLTAARLQEKADSYYNVVFPLVTSSPDIDNLYIGGTDPEKVAAYNRIFSNLAEKVERNYTRFLHRIGDPMPFGMSTPVVNNDGSYTFNWSTSESLTGQTIRYDIDISTAASFEPGTIVYSRSGIHGTVTTVPWGYPSGNYFYRIIARDINAPSKFWQVAYNEINLGNDRAYGIVEFFANHDNSGAHPVGNPDTANTKQDTAITLDVLINDIGTGLRLSSSTNNWSVKGGSVSISNNKIIYTPKSGYTGTDNFWYVLKDESERSNFSKVTINISSSAFPVGNPDTVSTTTNNLLEINALLNDSGSGLNLISSEPWSLEGGRVSISNNRILYTPKQDFIGEDKIWYVFEDDQGRVSSSVVTITVTGPAAYPVALTDNITTTVNTPIIFNALENDTGASLRVTDVNDYSKQGGRITIVNGQLRYTPKSGYQGSDSFWYVISDNINRTNAAKVTVTVN